MPDTSSEIDVISAEERRVLQFEAFIENAIRDITIHGNLIDFNVDTYSQVERVDFQPNKRHVSVTLGLDLSLSVNEIITSSDRWQKELIAKKIAGFILQQFSNG